jgi:hypothetical protein
VRQAGAAEHLQPSGEVDGAQIRLAFMSAHNMAFEIFVLGRPESQPPEGADRHPS